MKKKFLVGIFAGLLLLSMSGAGNATPLEQYASSVIGYSSQWSSSNWAAYQALGATDTLSYGDISTAWAPGPQNGSLEYLTLGFTTPVEAYGATIRETYGNGFVYQIDLLDISNVLHTVWTGTDNSLPGSPVDFLPTWTQTPYLVNGIKIYVNTNHNLGAWEEIDSVLLKGDTTAQSPVPEPSTMLLLGFGLMGLAGIARKKMLK